MEKLRKNIHSTLTVQQCQTIANLLMGAGVIYNLIDMMQGLSLRLIPTIISVVLVGIGFAWQLLFVRCPYCDYNLKTERTKMSLPDRCPMCNGRLDKLPKKKKKKKKAIEPAAQEEFQEESSEG